VGTRADVGWYSFALEMSPLNVDRLQSWIDQGRIDPSRPITMKELHESRCLHGIKDGVKLLARVCLRTRYIDIRLRFKV